MAKQAHEVMERIEATQLDSIRRAAAVMTESIAADRWVHTFGCGHATIPVEEMYPRIGGFVGFHPMVELPLTFAQCSRRHDGKRTARGRPARIQAPHRGGVKSQGRLDNMTRCFRLPPAAIGWIAASCVWLTGPSSGGGSQPIAAEAVRPGCEMTDGSFVRGPTDSRRLALVFTGHEYAQGAQTILGELAKHKARASFFPTGKAFLLLPRLGAGPKRTDRFHARSGELLDLLAAKGYQSVRVDELLEPGLRPLPAPPEPATFIRASQVGYRTKNTKSAVAFSTSPLPDKFSVIAADTGVSVFEGKVVPLPDERWGKFDRYAELDFTGLNKKGRYALKMGDSRSLPFAIDDLVLASLPGQLLEFMRQQQCGYNPWLRTKCHQLDGRTAYGPLPPGTPVDARGGWHDAADLLKYQLTSGNATAQMLLAYALSRQIGPEGAQLLDQADASGDPMPNGVPDLLDEARWGLDWLLKLHPAPELLYHQVADDRDHIGFRLPQNEIADYGWGKGGSRVVYFADGRPQGLREFKSESTGLANLAGRYAAAMALAYQTWKYDPANRAFAERCLKAGKEVFDLGRNHEGSQQGNSYREPYRYEETTWPDDMEWGAAELFRATGERAYLDHARRYAQIAGSESWMGREQARHYQFYPFMNIGHFRLYDLVDAEFQKVVAGYYRDGIEKCVRAGRANPYRVGVPFIWCSNNLVVALVTQCDFYERMTGDKRFRDFAARNRDWLLGRNPWGYTMFTEIGSVFPKDVHLQTTKLTGRRVRGGLVDGPVYARIFRSQRGVSITGPDPLAVFQDERAVYHDDIKDYVTNEPTMDGTAAAILMWAVGR
jgi:endoglucanase